MDGTYRPDRHRYGETRDDPSVDPIDESIKHVQHAAAELHASLDNAAGASIGLLEAERETRDATTRRDSARDSASVALESFETARDEFLGALKQPDS